MKTMKRLLPLCVVSALSPVAMAEDANGFSAMKKATQNIVDALVADGVISKTRAEEIVNKLEASSESEKKDSDKVEKGVVRIPYVPEFVKEEIRGQVRAELREDVVGDVMSQAKNERWGMPDALPDWTRRFKFKGDIRLRAQSELYADDNTKFSYYNYQAINSSGGFNNAGTDAYINTTEDRHRMRMRLRLGIDATVTNNLKASMRFATGNLTNPVSTNQTLGNYTNRYRVVLDRAYLKYDYYNLDGYPSLTFLGGRMPNPWFSTELVWDKDLSFEGLALQYRMSLHGSDNLFEQDERMRNLFWTFGVFPLDESELYSDKWLLATQIGLDLKFTDQSAFKVGLAYYDYQNIQLVPNAVGSRTNDWSAPDFVQKGNTYGRISNDVGETRENPRLTGLAADFDIVNLTMQYDHAAYAPIHIITSVDYAKNIAYDRAEVERLSQEIKEERTDAYSAKLTIGWPDVTFPGNWQMFMGYRYLERDSVVDAFTDSDFHLGGTDTKGFIVGGKYGINDNTWMQLRWLSADEIDGPLFGVDVLQLDLNAKF